MKKYLYILVEAALSVLVWIFLIVGLCFFQFNIVFAVFALIGSLYIIHKIILGVRLLIDMADGPKEKCTVFMGSLEAEHLDIFIKISFIFIMWDTHSCERILIPHYWKYPKSRIQYMNNWMYCFCAHNRI